MIADQYEVSKKLKDIILRLRTELEHYAQKEDARQAYVDKQNRLINDLSEIYTEFEELEYYGLWAEIEDRMKYFEDIDPEINAHNILFQVKPGKTIKQSLIQFKFPS
jgi:hypothetical protein